MVVHACSLAEGGGGVEATFVVKSETLSQMKKVAMTFCEIGTHWLNYFHRISVSRFLMLLSPACL